MAPDTPPEELEHWRAVAARPSDEAPRWAYLKYLERVGNTERARFTRLQLDAALARPWDFLALEAANFRSDLAFSWGPLAPRKPAFTIVRPDVGASQEPYDVTHWEGGFPSTLQVNKLFAVAPTLAELMTSAPITALELREFIQRDKAAEIVMAALRQPWVTRLRHLGLRCHERLFDQLLTQPSLQQLNSLSITLRPTSNAFPLSLRKLAQLPMAQTLRSLELHDDNGHLSAALGDELLFPGVERLTITRQMSWPDLSRLLTGMPCLRRLTLHNFHHGWGEGMRGWSGLTKLEELVVRSAHTPDLLAVLRSEKLERLRSLRIERLYASTSADWTNLFRSLQQVARVSLRDNRLGDDGLDALLASHAFPHLLALEVDDNTVSYAASFKIAKSIHFPKLKWLRLAPISNAHIFTERKTWEPALASAFE